MSLRDPSGVSSRSWGTKPGSQWRDTRWAHESDRDVAQTRAEAFWTEAVGQGKKNRVRFSSLEEQCVLKPRSLARKKIIQHPLVDPGQEEQDSLWGSSCLPQDAPASGRVAAPMVMEQGVAEPKLSSCKKALLTPVSSGTESVTPKDRLSLRHWLGPGLCAAADMNSSSAGDLSVERRPSVMLHPESHQNESWGGRRRQLFSTPPAVSSLCI